MADIDNKTNEVCPLIVNNILVQNKVKEFIYRVSWIINDKRQEEFFKTKELATGFILKLEGASELLKQNITPLIGEIEVQNE